MSLQPEELVRIAWIEATGATTAGGNLRTIPIDLLYFGGDDLLMALPVDLLDSCLAAFDTAMAKRRRTEPALPTSTFAKGLADKPASPGGHDETPRNQPSGRKGVNDLLQRAKAFLRETGEPLDHPIRALEAIHGLLDVSETPGYSR